MKVMASVADMPPPPVYRHPLGLPAGSVRATLALIIVGLFWLLLVIQPDKPVQVPLYLYFLMGLVLHFFGSHGGTIAPAGGRAFSLAPAPGNVSLVHGPGFGGDHHLAVLQGPGPAAVAPDPPGKPVCRNGLICCCPSWEASF